MKVSLYNKSKKLNFFAENDLIMPQNKRNFTSYKNIIFPTKSNKSNSTKENSSMHEVRKLSSSTNRTNIKKTSIKTMPIIPDNAKNKLKNIINNNNIKIKTINIINKKGKKLSVSPNSNLNSENPENHNNNHNNNNHNNHNHNNTKNTIDNHNNNSNQKYKGVIRSSYFREKILKTDEFLKLKKQENKVYQYVTNTEPDKNPLIKRKSVIDTFYKTKLNKKETFQNFANIKNVITKANSEREIAEKNYGNKLLKLFGNYYWKTNNNNNKNKNNQKLFKTISSKSIKSVKEKKTKLDNCFLITNFTNDNLNTINSNRTIYNSNKKSKSKEKEIKNNFYQNYKNKLLFLKKESKKTEYIVNSHMNDLAKSLNDYENYHEENKPSFFDEEENDNNKNNNNKHAILNDSDVYKVNTSENDFALDENNKIDYKKLFKFKKIKVLIETNNITKLTENLAFKCKDMISEKIDKHANKNFMNAYYHIKEDNIKRKLDDEFYD
jgi:hypothetical protein